MTYAPQAPAHELAGVVRFGHAWHVFVDGSIRPETLPDRLAAIDRLREIAQDAARADRAMRAAS